MLEKPYIYIYISHLSEQNMFNLKRTKLRTVMITSIFLMFQLPIAKP